ncbi:phospholipid carrier-dependent glycosyltransferase [Oscillochloris sp. ZM17-4]|uniref:ArnT family glycosyltransferase n=1 Tax=Oscillochloris sp. ZM17-4 TaxID=2866714 RepID=UPI001C73989F|nr:phospholipid carrier-dependent glycosyltransferase [Oscillochloris sp. ZM17-4]MBX0327182.1 phospholipid carrier-dependent glycosyltransferase [Oscillochloris sp. ZM17-4]
MRTPSRRDAWLAPLLIFALALAPRLWALGWGLPYVEHPDEPALVETVVRMVRDGSLNPRTFLYPSLSYYLLAAAARLHLAWGESVGLYGSAQDLVARTYTFTTQPQLYLWLRAVTALLGALTAPLLYLLGSQMFDRRAGLLAAAALALSRFHIEHSHYITTDAPTGLWVTLALLGAWDVARRGSWRGYLIGALGTGLAAGTKYNAGVVGLALAAAALVYLRDAGRPAIPRQAGRLMAAGLLSGLVFLIATPYAILDMPAFLGALRFNAAHYASGEHGDFTGAWPFGQYAAFYWADGLMPAGCLLLLAGLPALARRRGAQTAVLLSAILPMQLRRGSDGRRVAGSAPARSGRSSSASRRSSCSPCSSSPRRPPARPGCSATGPKPTAWSRSPRPCAPSPAACSPPSSSTPSSGPATRRSPRYRGSPPTRPTGTAPAATASWRSTPTGMAHRIRTPTGRCSATAI